MLGGIKQFLRKRTLRKFESIISRINTFESELSGFSDAALRTQSEEMRRRVRAGEQLDGLLASAFALVREASRRTLGQRPFDVQLMGGIVLHRGAVAEMMTGEGKTLAAVAPAYLNALSGDGVHVVTVNEYLARRDTVWMGQIYHALGLTVGCLVPDGAYIYDPAYRVSESVLLDRERDTTGSFLVQQEYLRPVSRREAYLADVTYGTNYEFGFDYLRDNLAYSVEQQVQLVRPGESEGGRRLNYAIIDEVDSILIDEARTPLIIAAPDTESSELYKTFSRVVGRLTKDEDYTVDEKKRSVSITVAGIGKVEKILGVENLYAPEHLRLVHYLEESLRAHALYRRDKDYVVKNGEVIIVDEFTGRLLHGRRYQGGLHQAIEAKEGVLIKQESRTYAKISIQNYFRLYKKIAGMTGTAQTSAEEFHKVYNLEVVSIPPNRPLVRRDAPDAIYKTSAARWEAVIREVRSRHEKGQPVLVGTTSIERNELISNLLRREGIPHEVLNAKNNEREGAIIAQAGRLGAVTVATNMAGRGVDIILGGNPPNPEEARRVVEAGGLHVLGTERHEARRIDNQLRGRSGRQGDPGSSQFFLSLEDDLLRIFGGERIKRLMERFDLPDDQPIEFGFVSKAVAEAQAKVEGANFDLRKHLLEYDDVLNKQRAAVYRKRQKILEAMNEGAVCELIYEAVSGHFEAFLRNAELRGFDADPRGLAPAHQEIKQLFEEAGILTKEQPWPEVSTDDQNASLHQALRDLLLSRSKEAARDPGSRSRLLGILDLLWMDHLENLEALSESVGLRAYGQKDPLVEYRQEAHRLYSAFWQNFNGWVFSNIFRLAEKSRTSAERMQTRAEKIPHHPAAHSPLTSAPAKKVGRNEPCPCGSGKKYKKCHGK